MIDEEKLELYGRIQRRLTPMIKDWDDESIVNFLNDFKEFKYHPITVADYQEYKRDVIEFNRSFYEPVVKEETVEEKQMKEEELFERILKRATPLFYDKIDEWSVAFLNEFDEFKENPITLSDYKKFKVWSKGDVGQVGQAVGQVGQAVGQVGQAGQAVGQVGQGDDKVKQIIDFIEQNPNKSNNWYATHNGVVGRSTYFNYLKEGKLDRLDR